MNRDQLKSAMRLHRQQARETMKALRAATAKALANNPQVRAARRRRRLKQLGTVLVLLLLLLFIRCEGPASPEVSEALVVSVDAGTPKKVVKAPPAKKREAPPSLASKLVERPEFDTPSRDMAPWVDAFRMQVAARSPRLAACFNGTDRPGALRWTTSVSRDTGAVGSHEFETMGAISTSLSNDQLTCLTRVLSSPGYTLEGKESAGLPERVSLVLEF